MTQNTVIWTPKSVETLFCRSFSQICCTTVFAATNSTGLSDLLSAVSLAHSHHITDLVSFSAGGAARCALLPPVCRHPYLFSAPQQHPVSVSVVGGICFLVNEGIQ